MEPDDMRVSLTLLIQRKVPLYIHLYHKDQSVSPSGQDYPIILPPFHFYPPPQTF